MLRSKDAKRIVNYKFLFPYLPVCIIMKNNSEVIFARKIKNEGEESMKKFLEEFKQFISRGNVMDMAVGVIIGGAFTGIVTSLVDDIINPILGIFGGINFDQLSIKLAGDATLNYGKFITAVINFLIMAMIVFLIVKTLNKAVSRFAPKEEKKEEKPATKVCPFCKSEIAIEATRCPHCTSILEEKK